MNKKYYIIDKLGKVSEIDQNKINYFIKNKKYRIVWTNPEISVFPIHDLNY